MGSKSDYDMPINYGGYADHVIEESAIAGAALTIEVAGAKKPRYGAKSCQSTRAKECLEHLTEGKVRVYAGFAHSNGSVSLEDDKGLDFVMRLNSFDDSILREAFKDMLEHPYLGMRERGIVDNALEKGRSFSLSNLITKAGGESRRLGIHTPSYNDSMADIIGLGTELYLANLIEEVYDILFEKPVDVENRFPFYCRGPDSQFPVMSIGESDVLVVAHEEEILETLDNLRMSEVSLHPFNDRIRPI